MLHVDVHDSDAKTGMLSHTLEFASTRIRGKKRLTLLKFSEGYPAKGHRDMMMDPTKMTKRG